MTDNITLPREVVQELLSICEKGSLQAAFVSAGWHNYPVVVRLRTALVVQTYELDPSIKLKGLEIALANCEKSHELTAKKYMDTLSENERLKEQMKKWMKTGGDNDIAR